MAFRYHPGVVDLFGLNYLAVLGVLDGRSTCGMETNLVAGHHRYTYCIFRN